jgi:hypothetical protein
MEEGPKLERRPGYKPDEELELRHWLAYARRKPLKTKFLMGAFAVAVLAVMGVIGLQQTTKTEAGNIVGINGCNGTTVAMGFTCDFAITLFDDVSTSGVVATATGGTLANISILPTCLVAPTGGGTPVLTLNEAG